MRSVATHGLEALERVDCGQGSLAQLEAMFSSLAALSAARDMLLQNQSS